MNDISAPPADTAPLTRKRLPNRRGHMLLDFEADGFRYTAGLGLFEDGRLAEVFLNSGKIGTAIETAARDSAVVASIAASAWRTPRYSPPCPDARPQWQR
jgi:hypothetical protein